MSHLNERTEKNCLNCNAEVYGKYCSVCGQENIEPAESAWHLVTHFFNDITHFDGKFFSTLKFLVTKPGFLSSEYKMGRRTSYLNPIRMYVFTSAIFFLIFFSLYHFDNIKPDQSFNGQSAKAINSMDSVAFKEFTKELNDGKPMTRQQFKFYNDSISKKGVLRFGNEYQSRKEYDSLREKGIKKDGWVLRQITYKQIEINEKYRDDPSKMFGSLINILMHNIPPMLFISLPLFALFLKFLYRRNKDFYYASHAIFSIHLYIFVFISLLAIILINKLSENVHWAWLSYISGLLYMLLFFYEYKAMRNFYGQRRAKTIVKFLLLNTWLLFIVLILFTIFLFFSFLKV
ncbi:MAG: DUF3667 domain-containing protein [Ferruginibacter sp.]